MLSEWTSLQSQLLGVRNGRISESQSKTNMHDFVLALKHGLANGSAADLDDAAWSGMRDVLTNLSRQRASQGFTPAETAIFVFSFKPVLFEQLRKAYAADPASLAEEIVTSTELLDKLGLFTMEVYQKTREALIIRQQQEMLELSTPVVELWTGILALPLIGTLDSARTQIVMQNLLEAIVARRADMAIIDITEDFFVIQQDIVSITRSDSQLDCVTLRQQGNRLESAGNLSFAIQDFGAMTVQLHVGGEAVAFLTSDSQYEMWFFQRLLCIECDFDGQVLSWSKLACFLPSVIFQHHFFYRQPVGAAELRDGTGGKSRRVVFHDVLHIPIGSNLAALKQDRAVAQRSHRIHVMAYKQNGSPTLSEILHFAKTFFLKGSIADRKHLVNN